MSTQSRSDGELVLDTDTERELAVEVKALIKPSRLLQGDFGAALHILKAGRKVARRGWNGKDMWLKLQVPDANSKMTLPYIYMSTAQGDLVPWLASQTDVLSDDWMEVP